MKVQISCFLTLLALSSCTIKPSVTVFKTYPVLDYKEEVKLMELHDEISGEFEELGMVRLYEKGSTRNCSYDVIIALAQFEARKIGGNLVKIINHIPPGENRNSCDQITAKILRIESREYKLNSKIEDRPERLDSLSIVEDMKKVEKGITYVYNYNGITLNSQPQPEELPKRLGNRDQIILKDGSVKVCRITKEIGEDVYYTYYDNGTKVYKKIPKNEIFGVQRSRRYLSKLNDVIILKDGIIKECHIKREDEDKVYITLKINGSDLETLIFKADIKKIIYAERAQ